MVVLVVPITTAVMKFSKLEVLREIRTHNDGDRYVQFLKWLETKGFSNFDDNEAVKLQDQFQNLIKNFKRFMNQNSRCWDLVMKHHSQWLDKDFDFDFKKRSSGGLSHNINSFHILILFSS
jgi:hypothetical protein